MSHWDSATPAPTAIPTPTAIPGLSGQMAYVVKQGNPRIGLMNADGSDKKRLTDASSSDDWPIFSPDGQRIAFDTNRNGFSPIYTMAPDGSDQRPMFPDDRQDNFQPTWSPDSGRLAFVSTRGGDRAVYVMNADGSNAAPLISGPGVSLQPAWSPDGRWIAVTMAIGVTGEIFVVSVDGGDPIDISRNYGISDTDMPGWRP